MWKPRRAKLNPERFNSWALEIADDYHCRYEIYYGGAGSGKSYAAVCKILLKACANRRKVLFVRKIRSRLWESVYTLAKELLDSMLPQFHMTMEERRTDYVILLSNGSQLIFRGLDDPEKVKSIVGLTDIVIEEATELCYDDFLQLDLRLRPHQEKFAQIFLMFNPVSKANWCYKHWFERVEERAKIYHSTWKENRFLPPEYGQMLEAMARNNPAYYEIYALGRFAVLDKRVFPQITVRKIEKEETIGLHFFAGLDFGYVNDPSALVWGYLDTEKRILYLTGEHVEKGMLNIRLAQLITSLGFNKEVIVADSAEPKSIDELKRLGIRRIRAAKKGPDSVLQGIDTLLSYSIAVDEQCAHAIEEFENYTWKKDEKTGEYRNEPCDSFNHCIDALRYGIQSAEQMSGIRVLKPRSDQALF